MSTLLIDPLFTGVTFTQHIRLKKSTQLAFIRPWIYKNGTLASGQFRCSVYDGATLLKEIDLDYTTINAAFTESYAHGYIRFDVAPLALNVNTNEQYHDYILEFKMVNYTNDGNNYLAVCREWDQRKYPIFGTLPLNDTTEPLGYELYNYRE